MTEPNRLDFDKPESDSPFTPSDEVEKREKKRQQIPTLPKRADINIDKKAPTTTMRAAVNLRIDGVSFADIAETLGLSDPRIAKRLVAQGLSKLHPPEDAEMLRHIEGQRAEALFNQSLAMAKADFLVDADDPTVKIPNTEKRQWHEQAGKDLALHAAITGAKAPAKVELSATTQELNEMVHTIIESSGGSNGELEADIWDVEEIPETEEDDDGDS